MTLLMIVLGCVPNFSLAAPKLETIMSEGWMDANTPENKRRQLSLKSSDSSLGSLLDEYNDEDLEKTNATLGNSRGVFPTSQALPKIHLVLFQSPS